MTKLLEIKEQIFRICGEYELYFKFLYKFILALVLSFWHTDFAAMSFPIDRVCLWIAVVIAVIALVDYTRAALLKLKEIKAAK